MDCLDSRVWDRTVVLEVRLVKSGCGSRSKQLATDGELQLGTVGGRMLGDEQVPVLVVP